MIKGKDKKIMLNRQLRGIVTNLKAHCNGESEFKVQIWHDKEGSKRNETSSLLEIFFNPRQTTETIIQTFRKRAIPIKIT